MADANFSPEPEGAPLPPVEELAPTEAVAPVEAEGSSLNLTVEDMPELSDLAVGDEITLKVGEISEDGNYSLVAIPIAPVAEGLSEEVPEDLLAAGPAGGGRELVREELLG